MSMQSPCRTALRGGASMLPVTSSWAVLPLVLLLLVENIEKPLCPPGGCDLFSLHAAANKSQSHARTREERSGGKGGRARVSARSVTKALLVYVLARSALRPRDRPSRR